MCKASPGRRLLWHVRSGGEVYRVQALRRESARLTIRANGLTPSVEASWITNSNADLDPFGFLLLILLALSYRFAWCQMGPTDHLGCLPILRNRLI
jgi:hypothetical protein